MKITDDTDKIDLLSSVDHMCICFCEDNRSVVPPLPLLSVTIVPMLFSFSVKQNKSFGFNFLLSSVDFFNEITDS